MNSHDLIQSFNYIGEDLVDEAEYGQFPARAQPNSVRRTFRRPLLVAALIAMLLLLVGCTIAYVLSMQSLKLGQQELSYDAFDPDTLEYLGKVVHLDIPAQMTDEDCDMIAKAINKVAAVLA